MKRALHIGRRRGEFESAAKAMRSIQGGHADPAAKGALFITDLANRARDVQVKLNTEPKNGRITRGVPDDSWQCEMNVSPLRRVDDGTFYVFMPHTSRARISGGFVRPKVDGVEYPFTCPEVFAELGTSYRVMVRFDPSEPAAGAAIFSLETGVRNRFGYQPGQWICNAEFMEAAPQVDLSGIHGAEGLAVRKRYLSRCRAEYRSTGIYGTRTSSATESRDGRGNVARVEMELSAGASGSSSGADCRPARPPSRRSGVLSLDRLTGAAAEPHTPSRSRRAGLPFVEPEERSVPAARPKARIRTWDELAGVK